jgi:hypothetical protein
MNYIKHLSFFFEKIYPDTRLNQSHVSLYMALFQFWNLNRFENPFKIIRSEVIKLSKIGSINTYHKCLHDLHQYGYLIYEPSFNPMQGSSIHLLNFDTGIDTGTCTNSIQVINSPRLKSDTGTDTGRESILKQYKHNTNNKTIYMQKQDDFNSDLLSAKAQCLRLDNTNTPKRKKVAPKKEKAEVRNSAIGGKKDWPEIPPSLDQVKTFFKIQEYPELEAHKFYNHFQSNGWKVGGKSPMKDWHAAARNWMLNFNKFNPPMKSNATHLNKNKNYGEPL